MAVAFAGTRAMRANGNTRRRNKWRHRDVDHCLGVLRPLDIRVHYDQRTAPGESGGVTRRRAGRHT